MQAKGLGRKGGLGLGLQDFYWDPLFRRETQYRDDCHLTKEWKLQILVSLRVFRMEGQYNCHAGIAKDSI